MLGGKGFLHDLSGHSYVVPTRRPKSLPGSYQLALSLIHQTTFAPNFSLIRDTRLGPKHPIPFHRLKHLRSTRLILPLQIDMQTQPDRVWSPEMIDRKDQ